MNFNEASATDGLMEPWQSHKKICREHPYITDGCESEDEGGGKRGGGGGGDQAASEEDNIICVRPRGSQTKLSLPG